MASARAREGEAEKKRQARKMCVSLKLAMVNVMEVIVPDCIYPVMKSCRSVLGMEQENLVTNIAATPAAKKQNAELPN